MEEKIHGKLKYRVGDFIVEEIGDNWVCKVGGESNLVDNLEEERDFLWCEMEKEDIDFFQAIKELSQKIGKDIRDIGYAGTKDKRALTSQRISIFKPDLEKIKNFKHPNITLKNFRWNKRKIKLGYLEGNHFKIVIRDVDKKDAMVVGKKIKGMGWFPNYFGAQRFGSLRGNNVHIGKLILKRDFEKAVWAILTDISENERSESRFAREKLKKEKDFYSAARYFPHHLRLEKQILFCLSKNPDDFVGAIKRADRKNMLMFVNAVQSKVFNEILERALERGLDFTQKGQQSCLLPGYKTRFYEGPLGEIEKEVLAENNLELSDFDVREIPYLRIKGSFRKAITEIKDLVVSVEDDKDFPGSKKILLEFSLPSGVYATTFLDNFFKFD
ncbi:MAG: tRNA pseudouridine(13) synthase TruD [archaeon]|nr:tRNA pseudouridine(13) synthase TruD [archaeon]MCR4323594.1 tRNA pseudouridine(13) synthase TruD [Nanoarchaeota archaeon]